MTVPGRASSGPRSARAEAAAATRDGDASRGPGTRAGAAGADSRIKRQAVIVSAAAMAANASSYVFTVVAARLLAPAAFGELSALMAVLVVGVVPAMSVQTGVALRVAALGRGGRRPEGRRV